MLDVMMQNFWPIFIQGLTVSLPLALVSFIFALVIAIITAMIRYAKIPVLSQLIRFYVWIIRGTPLLLQLLIVFYGLPSIGFRVNALAAAVFVFSINEGAYCSETMRGALESIDKGQLEAGYCCGLSYLQVMVHIVLPQALRTAFPALMNSLISMTKDTSLASNITVTEMLFRTQRLAGKNYQFMAMYLTAGLCYLIFCTVLTWLQRRIEKRLSRYDTKE